MQRAKERKEKAWKLSCDLGWSLRFLFIVLKTIRVKNKMAQIAHTIENGRSNVQ